MMRSPQKTYLRIPLTMLQSVRSAMLSARHGNHEVMGFVFCRRIALSRRRSRWMASEWVVPTPECYARQSCGGLELRQSFHKYVLQRYVKQGMGVVHLHTHPSRGMPAFSAIDDANEIEYASFLRKYVGSASFISGVYDNEMNASLYRVWQSAGAGYCHGSVKLTHTWHDQEEGCCGAEPACKQILDRQSIFGDQFRNTLDSISVALIGCGGIGAPFAEQLARLGVRRWVLIDPDRVEESNLNRLPACTRAMARRHTRKTKYVKGLIRRMWPRSSVATYSYPLEASEDAMNAAANCNLIVVATDNHYSRMLGQETALSAARPLLNLGTHIAADNGRQPRIYARITVPPIEGGWCLVCGEIVDAKQAALERSEQSIRTLANNAGYIPGIPAPAVFWVNNVTASLGVAAIHGALTGNHDFENGLDWVLDVRNTAWRKIDHPKNDHCFYCSPEETQNDIGLEHELAAP